MAFRPCATGAESPREVGHGNAALEAALFHGAVSDVLLLRGVTKERWFPV